MTTGTRQPGEFCWINLLTPLPTEAREFFGKLLSWTYVELPGMGHIVKVGGRDIGDLFDLVGPNTPKGTPPLIGVMVKVQSADATCKTVTSLGGKTKPAFDIMDQGRMAACTDPNGAEFDLWEPKKGLGTEYVAGMLRITPEMGKMPPQWATYFTVKDADETAREAAKLGAKLGMTMKDVPGVGRFCGITSPQGGTFYVIQYMR
jgi:predicted enzyme related to lactoylglutathione lyase